MKYIYWVVLLAGFISLVAYCNHAAEKRMEIIDRVMQNDLVIRGKLVDTKTSSNHSFGILLLNVDSVKTGKFRDTMLEHGRYPYKIKDGKAEIYLHVPYGIQKGDQVIIDSDKKTAFYHYSRGNKVYTGDLGVVVDPYDIDYVKENTIFKH